MLRPQFELLERLRQVANLPAPGEAAPAQAVVTVDERISEALDTLAGRPGYLANAALYPSMRNEQLRQRVVALEALTATQQTLVLALAAGADTASSRMQVLTAKLELAQADVRALQTAQQADDTRLAFLEAKQTLTASATEANRLDIVALRAEDAAQALRASKNETALAAAQATATQARAEAATAQAKADADAVAAQQAQTTATQALTTAQQAQAAQAAQAARWRSVRVAAPALAVGATATLNVVWAPAYADASYVAVAECEGTALLGLEATVTARAAAGCTVQIKNSLGLAVAAGAGTVAVLATHD